MSSLTNINNNSSVVNVGRTTPVSPGQQPASGSIPVVLATDQGAVPVVEQNKVLSEVALSLLGIPRAEVALGIFADVNTYDVNPSEWSFSPQAYVNGYGTKHLPNEAGALVEAPRNENGVLTSKRFFRYQPGRVSAATFGVKTSVSQEGFAQNPVIRKFGIFDNLDGYYWESRQSGEGDNFSVVRRTQSLLRAPITPFGEANELLRSSSNTSIDTIRVDQFDDYRITGKSPNESIVENTTLLKDRNTIIGNRYVVIGDAIVAANLDYDAIANEINNAGGSETANTVLEKCERDLDYWIDMFLYDMESGGVNHTKINTTNYDTAVLANTAYETSLHTALKDELIALDLTASGNTKVTTLADIAINFFTTETEPTINDGSGSDAYGTKSKIDTIFDAKKHYWSYVVTSKDANGDVISYSNTEIIGDFDIYDILYKCQRDVIFILDGYKNDIVGGGNAETKYNASMYYKNDGLSIYSQLEVDGSPTEIERHTHLQTLVTDYLANTANYSATSQELNAFETLSNLIINNFTTEDDSNFVTGNRGYGGNIVVMRDSLPMVHAGVYDPNLLKEKESIFAVANYTDNTFKLTKGIVRFGKRVKLKTGINANLVAGGIYQVRKVYGPKGNVFDLRDDNGDLITFDSGDISGKTIYFETVVPFIFPEVYNANTSVDIPVGAMFPYMYSENNDLTSPDETIGYINTAEFGKTGVTTETKVSNIRSYYDAVNFTPEYINWVKDNVKPEYYGVYEYRVPRSRFSHDKLDGVSDSDLVYSDVATGSTGTAYAGQKVTVNTGNVLSDSLYNFDFTKVTMLKIEFSWYGAVGALFLAYVPVSNGEARWVRVHHLRASNQLKIASLGNATLPITYNVYGGGDSVGLGDGEEDGGTSATAVADLGYNNDSHHIVKYGASYYIDGGDRGTVRLYSHANDDTVTAYGKQWTANTSSFDSSNNSVVLDILSGAGDPVDPVFFMNAKLKTGNRADSNIRVVWADDTTLYLSDTPQDTSSFTFLPDRANSVYGIETKSDIVSRQGNVVRNRVQVYPTKLSTSNLGNNPVRLRLKKTPIFQTTIVVDGTLQLTSNTSTDYLISAANETLQVTETAVEYIANGEEVYGWFQGTVDETEAVTVFGRLYRRTDSYYFDMLSNYNGTVRLNDLGYFLVDKRFDSEGNVLTGTTKSTLEKEGLSSVKIATDSQVPIPETGTDIATVYLQEGTEQIDLISYFDYNKEYLSYPLTNVADTLYFAVDSDTNSSTSDQVSLGVTWEEQ